MVEETRKDAVCHDEIVVSLYDAAYCIDKAIEALAGADIDVKKSFKKRLQQIRASIDAAVKMVNKINQVMLKRAENSKKLEKAIEDTKKKLARLQSLQGSSK